LALLKALINVTKEVKLHSLFSRMCNDITLFLLMSYWFCNVWSILKT